MRASLMAVLGAGPLFAFVAFAGCGGDDTPGTVAKVSVTASPASTVNDPKPSPKLPGPASKYSLLFEDVGSGYLSDVQGTFTTTIDNYAKSPTFASEQEGRDSLTKWGYQGGFETGYIPEGRINAVLNGDFYITIELHLFNDENGAKAAYSYFESKLKGGSAQQVPGANVGNQSSGWRRLTGKVGTSNIDAVIHTVVFRRGNLLAVVLTQGADPFMRIDNVMDVARIIDQKALGQIPAVEPTPASNFKTPTPNPVTPTPTPGGSR